MSLTAGDGGVLPNTGTLIGGKGPDGKFHVIAVDLTGGVVPISGTTVFTTAVAASKILKSSAGTLISLTVSNAKASAQFVQIFDSATLPADATVPMASYKVPAGDARSFDVPITGMAFANGIVACNSSTQATKTIGSADCIFLAVVR